MFRNSDTPPLRYWTRLSYKAVKVDLGVEHGYDPDTANAPDSVPRSHMTFYITDEHFVVCCGGNKNKVEQIADV